jgi:hypothetical protein
VISGTRLAVVDRSLAACGIVSTPSLFPLRRFDLAAGEGRSAKASAIVARAIPKDQKTRASKTLVRSLMES